MIHINSQPLEILTLIRKKKKWKITRHVIIIFSDQKHP
jgi:hypothetical protein